MGFKLPNGGDLSEEQLDIINLPTTKDWLIKGAPGTGKTVMAIYRAGQASQSARGKPVLMLVYNRPLMQFISTAVRGRDFNNVQVNTYHSWVNDIYKEHRLGTIPKDGDDHDWEEIASDLSRVGKKYAHVIVDEAQDFPIELLKILKALSGHMTCFIDPNQAIEEGRTDTYEAIRALCVEAPYTLTRNFRNTKPIRDLSALYCRDGQPAPATSRGKKPVIIKCIPSDFDDQNQKMVNIIKRNKEKEIGIIVNPRALNPLYNSLRGCLPDDLNVQMHKPMTNHWIDFDQPGVKIVSYGTMKGLEFDIVLLPMFDKIETQNDEIVNANRVYVAVSRAVSELYLFYWKESPSAGKIDTMSALTAHREMLEWRDQEVEGRTTRTRPASWLA